MTDITDIFPGHEPGQPYTLTRRQFCRFLEELWDAGHLPSAALQRRRPASSFWEAWEAFDSADQRELLWEIIASIEAARSFDEHMGWCPSALIMEGADMSWEYTTTSGTKLQARDHRFNGDSEGHCLVTIPEHRDQPGRTAWTQVRLAASGLPYACWDQERSAIDGPIAQRRELHEALYALREEVE